MSRQQILEGTALQALLYLFILGRRITADIMVVDVIGGSSDIDRCLRGTLNNHALRLVGHLTVGIHPDTALCCQTGRDTLLGITTHRSNQTVIVHPLGILQTALIIQRKI